MFNILVLGDTETVLEYLQQGGLENVSIEDVSQWEYQKDNINLTFEVPMNLNCDYDNLISMADGILYFLNPNSESDIEIFKELMKIIQGMKRDIHTIVVFRDKSRVIDASANELLNWIWSDYPFEACISDIGSQNILNMIINSLSESIIGGDMIVLQKNAWLRIPSLFKMANYEIEQQNWKEAGKLVEKIAKITRKNDDFDWTIYAEQAAWLYSRDGEFLSAAKIISSFNPVFSNRFRKMHVDKLISQGNRLFREKKFGDAAQLFEMAGNWARIELSNSELMKKSFTLAIDSWIAACETQNAFTLLEKFDHNEMVKILEGVTQNVAGSADYLSSIGQDEYAKAQLYLCFQRYQKAGLFESIKVFASKVVKILKRMLEKHLNNNDVYTAKLTLDELYNIWESFDVKSENIDQYLLQMGHLFIKAHDFQKAESIVKKIQSKSLKKQLTKASLKVEEKVKKETKQYELKDLKIMCDFLFDYVKDESLIFYELNKEIYDKSEFLVYNKDYTQASLLVKKQADWLRQIGMETLSFDVLEKVFDIYVQGDMLGRLINEIHFLPEIRRTKFLNLKLDDILNSVEIISHSIDSVEFENILTSLIKLYRNHLLYSESKRFSEVYIKFLKDLGIKIAKKGDDESILKGVDIIHQIEQVVKSYFEEKEVDLDPLLSIIVNYYIERGDLKEARTYNRRIKDQDIFDAYFSRMKKIEEDKGSSVALLAKQKQQMRINADKLSQLSNQAGDQRMASQSLLRMRIGLKKRYFQKGIDLISTKNLSDAAEVYSDIAKKLITTKKFELAGISAAVASLIYLILKEIDSIQNELDGFIFKVASSRKIFFETFPIKLINYTLVMINAKRTEQIKSALKLFDVLALFPEERLLLETLLGNDSDIKALLQAKTTSTEENVKKIPTNYDLLIEKLIYNPKLKSKRKTLEDKYWGECQSHLYHQKYDEASTCYLDAVYELNKRNLDIFSIDSIVMGFLLLLKIRQPEDVYKTFEKYVYQLSKNNKKISNSEEIQLLDILIRFWNKSIAIYMLREILIAFEFKLHLLDWESSFIKHLISSINGKKQPESDIVGTSQPESVEESGDTFLKNQVSLLVEDLNKNTGKFKDLKEKRHKMIRAYYKDILEDLKNKKFKDVVNKYEKLSKRMARRNDFDSSSLMILLSVLSQIQAKEKLTDIKSNINALLGSLGIVKKILIENFEIKVAYFIIDALSTNYTSIKSELNEIINGLPLLDEESSLIDIFN
jgi:hypothetical protein